MGDYNDCKNWDYENHPNRHEITSRCDRLVNALRRHPGAFKNTGYSTKPGHVYMFDGFAPAQCKALIGNFRGSNHPCLKRYSVGVGQDKRVGIAPQRVPAEMNVFEKRLKEAVEKFDLVFAAAPDGMLTPAVFLEFIDILCLALEQFLTIHPYANGNGHCGRLIVWMLLARYKYQPVNWPLDAKPAAPDYGNALTAYRDGNKAPLTVFLMNLIKGP